MLVHHDRSETLVRMHSQIHHSKNRRRGATGTKKGENTRESEPECCSLGKEAERRLGFHVYIANEDLRVAAPSKFFLSCFFFALFSVLPFHFFSLHAERNTSNKPIDNQPTSAASQPRVFSSFIASASIKCSINSESRRERY